MHLSFQRCCLFAPLTSLSTSYMGFGWQFLNKIPDCVCSVAQSCETLCDPMDCSPPGSSVHAIFRQEYWSGLPFPPPGDLPDPRIEPATPASPELAGRSPLSLCHLGSHIPGCCCC